MEERWFILANHCLYYFKRKPKWGKCPGIMQVCNSARERYCRQGASNVDPPTFKSAAAIKSQKTKKKLVHVQQNTKVEARDTGSADAWFLDLRARSSQITSLLNCNASGSSGALGGTEAQRYQKTTSLFL